MAVVLVLAFHAGVRFVPGGYVGVDVFFVISGFLITGLIVREVRSAGHLNLGRFYARRARRLLPATAVTFVGVALVTVLVLPVTRWASVAGDMVASALYVVNWRLAARSVEYLAQGAAASPLQHFWSLAVEEQFYIVWPLLIVALTWWARRRRRSAAVDGERGLSVGRLTAGLLVIVLPSLAWSVYLTATDPGPAYFVTTTRLWELGIGALLAVGAVQAARAPVVVRAVAGWVGLAAIGWSAVMFTAETRFPGSAALVPTLGAAAVLWAGLGDGRARVRVLDVAPLQDVGALSYSLYLWHWPVLVAATALWGDKDGHLWLPTALLAVAASAVPAWFTYRVVEQPLHLSAMLAAPWRAGVAGVVCVAIGLGSAGAITWSLDRHRAAAVQVAPPESGRVPESAAQESPTLRGAEVLGDDPVSSPSGYPVDNPGRYTPRPEDASGDFDWTCPTTAVEDADVVRCELGQTATGPRVYLAGDSHLQQWLPALRRIADRQGWRLTVFIKQGCAYVDAVIERQETEYTACTEWNRQMAHIMSSESPDVVIVSSLDRQKVVLDGDVVWDQDVLAAGFEGAWARLTARGIPVVVIRDTSYPSLNIPDCLAKKVGHESACAFPRTPERGATLVEAAAHDDLVYVVDVTDAVCPQVECAPVIGGILVYRDASHLSASYAFTVAPRIEEQLASLPLPGGLVLVPTAPVSGE